jgi:hypothetical protein
MTTTPTERRRGQAARFAGQLGLSDGDALYRGAMAAWSNLGSGVNFDHALSVAGVTLAAAQQASWRKCRHCHAAIYEVDGRWANRPAGGQPAFACIEHLGGGHEPAPGNGRRSFQLNSGPIRYGHGKQLMREVIQTDPAGQRSVFAVVPDSHALDIWELLDRVYDRGREDLAAERAAEDELAAERYDLALSRAVSTARELYARDEPGGCEDYARGQAALIAATFGLDQDRDVIADVIEGRCELPAGIGAATGGGQAGLPEGVDNERYFGLPVPGSWRPGAAGELGPE